MDVTTFDRLARTVATTGTRRTALGTLLAAAGTALGLSGGTAHAQGCLTTGEPCATGAACCSGRCRRRHGKKKCRAADNQGECTVEENICTGSGSIVCGTGDGRGPCFCYVTTRGRSFCGANIRIQSGNCDCTSDTECEERIGKGAKCVQTTFGFGSDVCNCPDNTTGCMAPCPNLDPV